MFLDNRIFILIGIREKSIKLFKIYSSSSKRSKLIFPFKKKKKLQTVVQWNSIIEYVTIINFINVLSIDCIVWLQFFKILWNVILNDNTLTQRNLVVAMCEAIRSLSFSPKEGYVIFVSQKMLYIIYLGSALQPRHNILNISIFV